jgi:hypothetical protein
VVGVSTVLAFLLASFVVFYRDRVRAGENAELKQNLDEMSCMLRDDWRRVTGFFRRG